MPRGTGYGPLAQALRQPVGMAGPNRLQVGPKNIGFNNMGNKQPQQNVGHPAKGQFQRPGGFSGKGGGIAPSGFRGFR